MKLGFTNSNKIKLSFTNTTDYTPTSYVLRALILSHILFCNFFFQNCLFVFVYLCDQADVEVTFTFPSLDKAEKFDPSWAAMDAQELCSRKGSTKKGGVGPFGLLTLASEDLSEYTPVFFRVFRGKDKHVVLMCSDATRFVNTLLLKVPLNGFVINLFGNMFVLVISLVEQCYVHIHPPHLQPYPFHVYGFT